MHGPTISVLLCVHCYHVPLLCLLSFNVFHKQINNDDRWNNEATYYYYYYYKCSSCCCLIDVLRRRHDATYVVTHPRSLYTTLAGLKVMVQG